MRKVKRLGPPKQFRIVRPGDFLSPFLRPQSLELEQEDPEDTTAEDTIPTNISNHEPLVLWTDPNDSSHSISVSSEVHFYYPKGKV